MFNTFYSHETTGPSRINKIHSEERTSPEKTLRLHHDFEAVVNRDVWDDLNDNIRFNKLEPDILDKSFLEERKIFCVSDYLPKELLYLFYVKFVLNGETYQYEDYKIYCDFYKDIHECVCRKSDFDKKLFSFLAEQFEKELLDKFLDICEDEMEVMEVG